MHIETPLFDVYINIQTMWLQASVNIISIY